MIRMWNVCFPSCQAANEVHGAGSRLRTVWQCTTTAVAAVEEDLAAVAVVAVVPVVAAVAAVAAVVAAGGCGGGSRRSGGSRMSVHDHYHCQYHYHYRYRSCYHYHNNNNHVCMHGSGSA